MAKIIQYHIATQRGRGNWQWDYFLKNEEEAIAKFDAIKDEWNQVYLTKEEFAAPGTAITYTRLKTYVGRIKSKGLRSGVSND